MNEDNKPNLFIVPESAEQKPNGLKDLQEMDDRNFLSSGNSTFQVFQFNESKQIRSIFKDKEPWFIAGDICKVLDIINISGSCSLLDDDEKADIRLTDVSGKPNKTLIVNESGLYSLIINSRKPKTKIFRKWITSVVLPSIRKTGSYSLNPIQQTDTRLMLQTLTDCVKQFSKFQETADQKLNYLYQTHKDSEIRNQENFKILTDLISKQIDNAAVDNYKQTKAYNIVIDPALTHATVGQFLTNNRLRLNLNLTYKTRISNAIAELTMRSGGVIHKIGGVKTYPIELLSKYFKENPSITM